MFNIIACCFQVSIT